ncbi:MAG: Oxygen-independent coproporphyrinogen-III oxidase 1 [Syntrophaceae bacterium PtaB.Bin038]|nr:MAG: Oxygen-independent coproporphyrinogen-III oxidase 1 [Syntrophaceae bacterium PtaB.Bin038]
MKYEGDIIRPPSEAHSLLLQVTVGCSHNRCTFCPSFKDKRFRIKGLDEIVEDLEYAARRFRRVDRLFLCDGDALIIPQKRLIEILDAIRARLPGVGRIGTYANAKSIRKKSVEELRELKERGLGIVYLGIESGNEEILARIRKGATPDRIVEAARRVKEAGITLSVTVLLGIGGTAMSAAHARDTARVLTDVDPDFAGVLTVMIVPGTPLYEEARSGGFVLPGTFALLEELGVIVSGARFTDCFFTANHASNYLPIRARMPGDREKVLRLIGDVVRRGDASLLRPESMRGL